MVNYSVKLIKGAGIIFLMSIITSGFAYFIRVLLAKKMTIEEFGLFFAVYSVVLMIGTFKSLGTSASLQKFVPEFQIKNDYDSIKSVLVFLFSFSLITSIFFIFLIILFPADIINNYFKSNLAKSLFLLLFVSISIDCLAKVVSGYFLSKYNSFLFSLRELSNVTLIVILLLLLNDLNVIKAALVYILSVLFGLTINFSIFFRHFPFFKCSCKITKDMVKKIFKFGIALTLKDFVGVFMTRADTLVLVYFRPLAEVAVYNAIIPTVELLLLFSRPFSKLMFPLTSELWALNEKKRILFLIKMVYKYLFIIFIFLGICLYQFSKFVLETFFGTDYAIGSFGMKILTLGFMLAGMNMISKSVLIGIGKPTIVAIISIGGNIINLILNLLLIPLFGNIFNQGYLGAIISTIFCIFISFIYFEYYLHKQIGYFPPLADFFYIIVCSSLASAVGYLLIQNIFSIYSIYIQIGIFIISILVVYILNLFLFGVISKKEIKDLVNLLLKKESSKISSR